MGEGGSIAPGHIAYMSVVYCFENKKDSLTVERHESRCIMTGPLWRFLDERRW